MSPDKSKERKLERSSTGKDVERTGAVGTADGNVWCASTMNKSLAVVVPQKIKCARTV